MTDLSHLVEIKKRLKKRDILNYAKWRVMNWNEFWIFNFSDLFYRKKKNNELVLSDAYIKHKQHYHLHETYFGQFGNYFYRNRRIGIHK